MKRYLGCVDLEKPFTVAKLYNPSQDYLIGAEKGNNTGRNNIVLGGYQLGLVESDVLVLNTGVGFRCSVLFKI